MEENQPKTGKIAWIYGLVASLIGVTFSVMLYAVDMLYDESVIIKIIPVIILAVAIILAIIQFKKANNGFLKLSNALKLGAGIGVVSGIIGIIYFLFQINILEPEYMNNMYEIGKQKALASNPNLTIEQIDQGIEIQKKFMWISYPIIIIFNIIIGLIVGLIGGLVMKKEESTI